MITREKSERSVLYVTLFYYPISNTQKTGGKHPAVSLCGQSSLRVLSSEYFPAPVIRSARDAARMSAMNSYPPSLTKKPFERWTVRSATKATIELRAAANLVSTPRISAAPPATSTAMRITAPAASRRRSGAESGHCDAHDNFNNENIREELLL